MVYECSQKAKNSILGLSVAALVIGALFLTLLLLPDGHVENKPNDKTNQTGAVDNDITKTERSRRSVDVVDGKWHDKHGEGNDDDDDDDDRPGGYPQACGAAISRKRLTMKTVNEAKAYLKRELFAGHRDRYATAIRIAFHDCVGGCDGCFNEKHPENAGFMVESLKTINRIYEAAYASKMSRADFWILTAVTALEESLKFNNANLTSSYINPVVFKFRYGRCDCPTSPVSDIKHDFPFGHFDYNKVMKFFKREFGFNMKESVAIMGAHTLGGASGKKGSGFDGFWKEDRVAADRLNNRYYSVLVNDSLHWNHVDRSRVTNFTEERWQWEAGATKNGVPAPFMLNADVALFKNVRPKSNGQSTCQFKECAPSPSSNVVKEYARNGDAWIRDFAVVFDKMVSKGANKLEYPSSIGWRLIPIPVAWFICLFSTFCIFL